MTDKDKKRLALRFLKEIGLLEAWKLYTKKEKINKKWYNKAFVDKIFGDSSFTYFLKIKYSIFLRTTITGLFRYYLIEIKEIVIKDIISVKKPIKANPLKSEKWEEMPMMIEK